VRQTEEEQCARGRRRQVRREESGLLPRTIIIRRAGGLGCCAAPSSKEKRARVNRRRRRVDSIGTVQGWIWGSWIWIYQDLSVCVLQNRADCRIEVNTLVEVERAESRAGFLFLGGGREGGALRKRRFGHKQERRAGRGQDRTGKGSVGGDICWRM
jgi:hypothetical protein